MTAGEIAASAAKSTKAWIAFFAFMSAILFGIALRIARSEATETIAAPLAKSISEHAVELGRLGVRQVDADRRMDGLEKGQQWGNDALFQLLKSRAIEMPEPPHRRR